MRIYILDYVLTSISLSSPQSAFYVTAISSSALAARANLAAASAKVLKGGQGALVMTDYTSGW